MFMAGQVGSYIQFLVLVLVLVIYSFTNVFQKQPATCTRCPSSWAGRVWCAGRRASCCVRMSGRGRPGGLLGILDYFLCNALDTPVFLSVDQRPCPLQPLAGLIAFPDVAIESTRRSITSVARNPFYRIS